MGKNSKMEFKILFEYQEEHEESPTCGFCEVGKAVWWCEFLADGWCSKCMKDQNKEYDKLYAEY